MNSKLCYALFLTIQIQRMDAKKRSKAEKILLELESIAWQNYIYWQNEIRKHIPKGRIGNDD